MAMGDKMTTQDALLMQYHGFWMNTKYVGVAERIQSEPAAKGSARVKRTATLPTAKRAATPPKAEGGGNLHGERSAEALPLTFGHSAHEQERDEAPVQSVPQGRATKKDRLESPRRRGSRQKVLGKEGKKRKLKIR